MPEIILKPEYESELWYKGVQWVKGRVIGKEETVLATLTTWVKEIFAQYELDINQEFKLTFKRVK